MLELKQLDDQFWREEKELLLTLLLPLITQSALDGSQTVAASILVQTGVSVDAIVMNEAVVKWAQRYTFDLVSGITDTTRRILQREVSQWAASGEPLSVLRQALEPTFGKVRAEMIASTEATRAFAEGNLIAAIESGVVEALEWNTSRDDRVCPICRPLDGKTSPLPNPDFDGNGRPPAHVRCRCWTNEIVASVEEAVI